METHIYDVHARKFEGCYFINSDDLKVIIEGEKINYNKELLPFRKLVYNLWADCITKGSFPCDDPNTIMVEFNGSIYCYDSNKIAKNQDLILDYLRKLHVLDPHLLEDGTRWTKVKQPLEFLLTMGKALEIYMKDNNIKITR